jgi:hypothetical protein
MLSNVMAALAAAWGAVAVDVITESALTDGPVIRLFGRTAAEPAPRTATLLLVLAGISLGAIVMAGITTLLQNRRARAFGAEIHRRTEERALTYAGLVAKNDLLTWRINELQQHADELLAKRDKLLDELGRVSARTKELRAEARLSEETLAELTEQLVVMPELRSTPDDPPELDR